MVILDKKNFNKTKLQLLINSLALHQTFNHSVQNNLQKDFMIKISKFHDQQFRQLINIRFQFRQDKMGSLQNLRFTYLVKDQTIKQHQSSLTKQFLDRYISCSQTLQYLKKQGYFVSQNELLKLSLKLFHEKKEFFSKSEVIAIFCRLNIQEELEQQIKKLFKYFSSNSINISTADLKVGLAKLGQTLKDNQIDLIFLQLDINRNGYIDFQSFLEAMIVQ